MHLKIIICAIVNIFINKINAVKVAQVKDESYNELSDHITVKDEEFSYVAAILEKSRYIGAGALINQKWVLTAANTMFQQSETIRLLRVRLGSNNYKKGGILLPIKSYEVHPYYDDSKPEFDIALILLAERVKYKLNVNPIKLQEFPEEIMTTHFVVNSWLYAIQTAKENLESLEKIKRRRMLTVSHLHPTDKENCTKELGFMGIKNENHIFCLDPPNRSIDTCMRDVGAPVVFNGILWGIISSWHPKNCDIDSGYTFVTLVSAPNVSSWIHAMIHGQQWNYTTIDPDSLDISDEDDDDDDE